MMRLAPKSIKQPRLSGRQGRGRLQELVGALVPGNNNNNNNLVLYRLANIMPVCVMNVY